MNCNNDFNIGTNTKCIYCDEELITEVNTLISRNFKLLLSLDQVE